MSERMDAPPDAPRNWNRVEMQPDQEIVYIRFDGGWRVRAVRQSDYQICGRPWWPKIEFGMDAEFRLTGSGWGPSAIQKHLDWVDRHFALKKRA